jgi:iron complex outermembrane receptor protein
MKIRHSLMTSAAALALAAGSGPAMAATTGVTTATGTEGAEVEAVVVTAESNAAAIAAPSKASILETQPQSIITHRYIEQSTPESGDYTTAVLIAPSVGGISSNGGGVGDTNTVNLRGFQDGQYNLTYDGIAFGDANDTTHHPAAFFPGSTIGAAVVDRGPGAAGDLGQANFGGAIHLFSPTVSDKFGILQKVTYGSFNTQSYVTQIQTGAISQLHGAKLFLTFDERSSDSELSYAGGIAFNQTAKLVVPVTDKLQVTAFASFNYTRYFQTDNGAGLGMGVTPAQEALYGKNFSLNNIPTDEHYFGFNHVKKHTYFSYIDTKWEPMTGLTVEDQLYDYYYNNSTISSQAANDLVGQAPSPNSSPVSPTKPGDIGGYNKLNHYQTFGDILRINKDFGFGTLRTGGLLESSWARRFILNYDLTSGAPDIGYAAPGTNISYIEPSRWIQYQIFADFELRPTDNLTITPGIKYIDYKRSIDGVETRGNVLYSAVGSRNYSKTAYFGTINYRITPHWSVYGQAASGFLIPPVKTLAAVGGAAAATQPEQTVTLQAGTVYTEGRITADFDYYHIDATNVLVNAQGTACQCYRNLGSGTYSGVEGEAAYAFPLGLTVFANGSINTAKDTNLGNGIAGGTFSNAPKGTMAYGLIYDHGPWQASASDKWVGAQIGSDGATHLGPYDTIDASLSYDFGLFKLKVAAFNLADRRARVDFDGTYTVYQVGRQVQGTFEAKF